MAIDKEMTEALNGHINKEFYSAYFYLSMASWAEDQNLLGLTNWLRCHYLEETMHAMKMYNFLNDRGGRVRLDTIQRPKLDWDSPLQLFKDIATHEAGITTAINNLVVLAREKKDFASESFLMWYVDEQVEEEATALKIIARLELIAGDPNGLVALDAELQLREAPVNALPVYMGHDPSAT